MNSKLKPKLPKGRKMSKDYGREKMKQIKRKKFNKIKS